MSKMFVKEYEIQPTLVEYKQRDSIQNVSAKHICVRRLTLPTVVSFISLCALTQSERQRPSTKHPINEPTRLFVCVHKRKAHIS